MPTPSTTRHRLRFLAAPAGVFAVALLLNILYRRLGLFLLTMFQCLLLAPVWAVMLPVHVLSRADCWWRPGVTADIAWSPLVNPYLIRPDRSLEIKPADVAPSQAGKRRYPSLL